MVVVVVMRSVSVSEDFKREDVALAFVFSSLQEWAYAVHTTKRCYPEVSRVDVRCTHNQTLLP